MTGGLGRKDEPFRKSLADPVAGARLQQGGLGHGTAGFHGTPPHNSSAWTSTTPATASSPVPAGIAPHAPVEPVRPCWYEAPWGRQPALLLQWRRVGETSSHHVGLIVVAAPDETGTGWTVIRLWVDAAQLTRG